MVLDAVRGLAPAARGGPAPGLFAVALTTAMGVCPHRPDAAVAGDAAELRRHREAEVREATYAVTTYRE